MKKALKDWKVWTAIVILGAVLWALNTGQTKQLKIALELARGFSFPTLATALVLCTLQGICMGLRAWGLTPKGTSLRVVLWAVTYGQFASAFLPARAGEALKLAILGDKKNGAKLSYFTATGVLIADRVADLAGLLIFIFFTQSYRVDKLNPDYPSIGWKVVLGLVALHLILFAAWKFFLKARFPTIREKLNEFKKGLAVLFYWKHILPALFFSTLTWACEVFALHTLMEGMGASFSFGHTVAILVLLNLAISIPISVANLGTFEASIVFALGKLGIPLAPAIAIAVVHHTMQLLGIILASGICKILNQKRSAPV